MELLHALILGIVEGLTEFVPVSSTGHLILAGAWLGLDSTPDKKAAVDAFDIVIQAGAWLACLIYYFGYLKSRAADLFADDIANVARGRRLVINLMMAFIPVVVVGLPLRSLIKSVLFGAGPVAVALAVGGVVMIAAGGLRHRQGRVTSLDAINMKQALVVGLFQCFSLIPGTSRSMATIIGGMTAGMTPRVAADFSFLLAVPGLGSATAYELFKEWDTMSQHIGVSAMAIGVVASFVIGWASIAAFLRLLTAKGLAPFGVYRIVLAGLVWWQLL